MKIIPLNNHVLIEPVVYDSFIAAQKETYEEKGVVLAIADSLIGKVDFDGRVHELPFPIKVGDVVLFDSWLAAKFPAKDGKDHWLVPFENIRAYETNEQVPE